MLPLIQVNTNKILIRRGGSESVSFKICQPGSKVMFGIRNAQRMTHLVSVSCLLSLPVLSTGLGSSQGAVLQWEHFGFDATSVRESSLTTGFDLCGTSLEPVFTTAS